MLCMLIEGGGMLGAIIIWFYYGIPMPGICIGMPYICILSDLGGAIGCAIASLGFTAALLAISLAMGGESLSISSDCMLNLLNYIDSI